MNARPATARVATGLIADDARMRKAIRTTVQDLAREIHEAEDERAAVEAYLRHKPGWVTMDVDMSPVDGLTGLREIKSINPAALVMIVTAHDTEAFREAARIGGAAAYILKDELSKIRDVIAPGAAEARRKNLIHRISAMLLAMSVCFSSLQPFLHKQH
jgi:two-component system, chemotaxis family, chemotaxis protein CheY